MKRLGAVLALCAVIGSAAKGHAEPWAAESGMHGAGLGMRSDENGRAWVDVGFFTRAGQDQNFGLGTVHTPGVNLLSPILGLGFEAGTSAEIEAILPTGAAFGNDGGFVVGNPFLGVSYVGDGPGVRLKVGGGIAFPLVNSNNLDSAGKENAAAAGPITNAIQGAWLWAVDSLGFVVPFHLEAPLGTPGLFLGDAALYVLAPVRNGGDTNLYMELAPGGAFRASDGVVLGARLPIVLRMTSARGDSDQVSFEPFIKFESDSVFFTVKFTMPIDEPLGFAFDTGKVWGLHAGLGGAF